jgi:hypothetical protein
VYPTSADLLTGIADALDRQVLPALTDKWAASTARSASQLLRHLALRVEGEPRLLQDEARELATVLTEARLLFDGPAGLADIRVALDKALNVPTAESDDLPCLRARHEVLSNAAETVIAARDRVRQVTGSSAIHDRIVDCLLRHLDRERALIEPFQSLPPI